MGVNISYQYSESENLIDDSQITYLQHCMYVIIVGQVVVNPCVYNIESENSVFFLIDISNCLKECFCFNGQCN